MNEVDKKLILDLYESNPDNFTCKLCKSNIKINTCKGCPIYVQSFNPD